MEVGGRMLDMMEAPNQSRSAKPASHPDADNHHDDAPSFVQTMIGLVTPPTAQEMRPVSLVASQSASTAATANMQSNPNAALYVNEISATPQNVPTLSNAPVMAGQALLAQDPNAVAQVNPNPDDLALVAMFAALGTQSLGAEPSIETVDTANLALLQTIVTPTNAGPKAVMPMDLGLQTKMPATPTNGANGEAWSTAAAQSNEYSAGAAGTDVTSTPIATADSVDLLALGLDPLGPELTGEAKGPSANRAGDALSAQLSALKGNGLTGWLNNAATPSAESGASAGSPNPALLQASNSGQALGLATGALVGTPLKSASKDGQAKVEGVEATTASPTLIGSGDGATTTGSTGDLAVPAGSDAAYKPPTLGPQTIPLLAAAMMRRYNNGMKEFTLRLDPPELGRVDVRLTVGANKKVRAVVSTDRPEALSDLTRSARDLTRALMESGLELEENGLSFSMNDQGNAQHQNTGDQSAPNGRSKFLDTIDAKETARTDLPNEPMHRTSGPVETWQRARIALTA
jgi:flagellar hook-length control protein FliK